VLREDEEKSTCLFSFQNGDFEGKFKNLEDEVIKV